MLVILPYAQEEGKEILKDCNAHTQQGSSFDHGVQATQDQMKYWQNSITNATGELFLCNLYYRCHGLRFK